MDITKIIPAELSGFCDVATGECVVTDTDTDAATAHGPATEGTSQPLEVPDDRPDHAMPKGS